MHEAKLLPAAIIATLGGAAALAVIVRIGGLGATDGAASAAHDARATGGVGAGGARAGGHGSYELRVAG